MLDKDINTKVCGRCKQEFPKTEDYFFKRVIKQVSPKTGELQTYLSFKSKCKKCHGQQGNDIRIVKRCKELNCNVSEYHENWKKQYTETRTLVKEISHLPKGVKSTIRKKIKKGYVFTNHEKYRIDCGKNVSKATRKYDYGNIDFVPKGTQTGIKYLTDGYIALTLGMKVKEIPKEIIETKRLIIQLKRELKPIK